jgi:hypothetical protein
MAFPFIPQFRFRHYATATTSSSGAPVATSVVVSRCKYVGGWFAPNNAGTSTNVTGFDVFAFLGGATTATVISSGTSVTTTTGTLASPVNVTATAIVYLNPGDIIITAGSTCQAGFVTHLVQEF